MTRRLVDLSVPLEGGSPTERSAPQIEYVDHVQGLREMAETFGVSSDDLAVSGGLGWAYERLSMSTHAGTHLDAPWHYGPESEGKPARTIDDVPLEWCYSDGVVLDVRHRRAGELITVEDLRAALDRIGYELKPLDIVLIQTGCDRHYGTPAYFDQPGMGRESTLWLVEQGIRVIGIDAYGFDRSFADMRADFERTGDGAVVWEAHFAGITREYCQIEKVANLDRLPRPLGFTVACFPLKIARGSASFVRVVAIVDE